MLLESVERCREVPPAIVAALLTNMSASKTISLDVCLIYMFQTVGQMVDLHEQSFRPFASRVEYNANRTGGEGLRFCQSLLLWEA